MIQLNMATGELISPDFGSEIVNQQQSYEVPTTEPQLQPCFHEVADMARIPVDIAMVDASLFIAGQF